MKATLTRKAGEDFKLTVVDSCGWMASVAVEEVFEDSWFHGKNQVCQLKDETDHLLIVIDSDCPDASENEQPEKPRDSVITELCQQGIVLYYYHTIQERHHHVCLALKKKAFLPPATEAEN